MTNEAITENESSSSDSSTDESVDSLLAAVARIPVRSLEWRPPEQLDEYRIVRQLGRGGMGSVWLAEDRLLDRLVAIKFIVRADLDARTRERFAIEARAAARLAHVNVVTVHRFGELAGQPYIVAEYIRGESLDKLSKPLPWPRCLELGTALARGLAAAHRHGIIHRDIKPANAILAADGGVKLVDFGLARLGDDGAGATQPTQGSATLTATGAIAGTPLYLAPEVRAGEPADRRSDVYQLGAVLYELATGRAPFLELDGADEPPSLATRIDADGAKFAAVVDRCLRRDPAARFSSGDEIREALEAAAVLAPSPDQGDSNPYLGMVPFDAEHRALFFGRGAELRAVTERLRAESIVVVTGDSGVGKSSLCRAGVLPQITAGALGDGASWTVLQMVPGRTPIAAIAALLAPQLGIDEAATLAVVRERPAELTRELRRALGPGRGVLVFIDQLEELTTLSAPDETVAFAHVIASLGSGAVGVRVLATVRSDFVTRLAEIKVLGDAIERSLYVLRSLSAEGAREAVVGPARARGATFESDALVRTLVESAAGTRGGAVVELPLLAFTLAALWDARDTATQTITSRSLDQIGGVRGALARHADDVLESLLPHQRVAAKKLLLRLVTPERTRARRTLEELGTEQAVLDALVRGRLVVARGGEPPMFELAHERLIDGWPAFSQWLRESNEAHAFHDRLATAVAAWERLGRAKEALWRERQLAPAELLDDSDLTANEREFLTRSRRAIRHARVLRWLAVMAVPLIIASVVIAVRIVSRRDLAKHVANKVAIAHRELILARAASADSAQQRAVALARFDAGDAAAGEQLWAASAPKETEARAAYARASAGLEAALLLDTTRRDVRRELAALTFERIELAERDFHTEEANELRARLALYDDGRFASTISGTGRLHVTIDPPNAELTIASAGEKPQPLRRDVALPPGVYSITASSSGRTTVRMPVQVKAGESHKLDLSLPSATAVPDGYAYVPAGSFLYGSREDDAIRKWFATSPMHEMHANAFLIGKTEVTYEQWIEYLDSLPPNERALRTPRIETSATVQEGGTVELERRGTSWVLHMTPSKTPYVAAMDEPLVYADRAQRRQQNWLRFPVSGISPADAIAYAAWLDRTKRVPRARLCTEPEWEYAMRGVDGRPFPHGENLAPDDANIDITYGQREGGFGPDEVGAHPASTSPFGLVDGSGNVWEIVQSPTGFGTRGGGFYTGPYVAHLANRQENIPDTYRHLFAGVRICADAPPP